MWEKQNIAGKGGAIDSMRRSSIREQEREEQ
jgi:hypothetical protein